MNIKVGETQTKYIIPGLSWLAAFWSYSVNHSILWAIFHWFVGPAYLAYRIVFHTTLLPR